jgi:hypothetical protein
MSQTPSTDTPPAIPSPPRAITATARRRSWAEMSVRIWCVLAATLAVVIIYFTINQVIVGASERDLILHGIPVDAVAVQIGGTTNPDAPFRRGETLAAKVRYTLPGETEARVVPGSLSIVDDPAAVIHPGDHLPLRVDRNDPTHWTDRTQPRSLLVEMSVVLILLPLLIFIFVIALLQRARILRIWRVGDVVDVTVIEIRQTALAPLSRQVRFSVSDGSNSRVCAVLVPTRAGIPNRGDAIALVMPRGVPQRAVLAKLYI